MSDLVPEDKRGEYFGWRNQTLGFIAIILTFAAGLILQIAKPINIFYGFAALFILAFIFRIFCMCDGARITARMIKIEDLYLGMRR